MKKWALCVGMVLVLGLAVSAMAADVLVGACIYKFDDTFMTGVRNAMNAEMKVIHIIKAGIAGCRKAVI